MIRYVLGEDESFEDFLYCLDRLAGTAKYVYLAGCKQRSGQREVDALVYYPQRVRVDKVTSQLSWTRRGARGRVRSVEPQASQDSAVESFRDGERRLEEEYPLGFSASCETLEEVARAHLQKSRKR